VGNRTGGLFARRVLNRGKRDALRTAGGTPALLFPFTIATGWTLETTNQRLETALMNVSN
jgi:hypothetical protein